MVNAIITPPKKIGKKHLQIMFIFKALFMALAQAF